MSLNWDLTKIENYQELCWLPDPTEENPKQTRLNPVTESLIWATMAVDIGRLTEKNLDEFAYRVFFYERAFQSFMNKGGEPEYLTYEDIKAHIGLSTNVIDITQSQWMKRIKEVWAREFSWQARRKLEDAKKPKLELVQ